MLVPLVVVMQTTVTLPLPGSSAFLCKYGALNVTFSRKILQLLKKKKRQSKQVASHFAAARQEDAPCRTACAKQ